MRFALFPVLLLAPCLALAQSVILNVAGATFPAPIYQKWFDRYHERVPDLQMNYAPVGSDAGVKKLLNGEIDLGASDNPLILDELAPGKKGEYLFVPSVVGAVVPIVNLPGFPNEISFTPEMLAAIYRGKITRWNDPWLRKINPGMRLPNLEIKVIHRSDGSGTSYAFSNFLAKADAEWNEQVGVSSNPKWPLGKGAEGNAGVAAMVKEFGGAIGYVEYIYALQNHLNFGRVKNAAGQFVLADLESIQRANRSIDDLKSYPMISLTWFVVPTRIADEGKRKAVKDFLTWMLGPGQKQAAALGYAELPAQEVDKAMAMLRNWN